MKSANSKSKKIVIIVICVFLCAAVAVGAFFLIKALNSNNSGEVSEEENVAAEQVDNASTNTNDVSPNPQTPAQYDGDNPNNSEVLTGVVSFAGPRDGALALGIAIDQAVSGECEFSLVSNTGATIVASGVIEMGPTSSFCEYTGDLSYESGSWGITVKVKGSDGRTGTITGKADF